MKISILMPVKNADVYLRECLETILAQTADDWELLAVNDHSTDTSAATLKEFSQKDKRIQVFDNQGDGIIEALRLAYTHSTGTYITRMDADDLMPPPKLATLRHLLTNSGQGHIATGLVKYFAKDGVKDGYRKYENWLNQLTQTRTNFNDIYKECVIPSPCWMLHRTDLEACATFRPDRYPEDYDLCFRMYEADLKVIASDDILHLWRDHPTRASRNDDNYADNRFLKLKLYYFLKLERKKGQGQSSDISKMSDDLVQRKKRPLVIWGAGKKGKNIAKSLIQQNISFDWVCENDRKTGVNIYGQILQSPAVISHLNDPQVIVAVAGEMAQQDIITYLQKNKLEKGQDYFLFC